MTKSSLEAGRVKARALHALFTKLESMSDLHAETGEAHEVVREIIKQAHEFPLVTLGAALQSSMLELTLKQYLPKAIGKLARYYFATFELVCATRDKTCCVFQNV